MNRQNKLYIAMTGAFYFACFLIILHSGYLLGVTVSNAMPYPVVFTELANRGGDPNGFFYWSFIFLTFLLPYALLAAICGFLSASQTWPPLAVMAVLMQLLWVKEAALSDTHWWVAAIFTLTFCVSATAYRVFTKTDKYVIESNHSGRKSAVTLSRDRENGDVE